MAQKKILVLFGATKTGQKSTKKPSLVRVTQKGVFLRQGPKPKTILVAMSRMLNQNSALNSGGGVAQYEYIPLGAIEPRSCPL